MAAQPSRGSPSKAGRKPANDRLQRQEAEPLNGVSGDRIASAVSDGAVTELFLDDDVAPESLEHPETDKDHAYWGDKP